MNHSDYLDIWVTLVHTNDAISRLRQRELKPYHISAEQTGVLSILRSAHDSLTPAEISRRLIRDPSSVTVILNRMVAKGLIKKAKDKIRKNLVRVTMTDKGVRLYNQILNKMCIYELFSALPDEHCAQLKTHLNTLLDKATRELK